MEEQVSGVYTRFRIRQLPTGKASGINQLYFAKAAAHKYTNTKKTKAKSRSRITVSLLVNDIDLKEKKKEKITKRYNNNIITIFHEHSSLYYIKNEFINCFNSYDVLIPVP